MIQDVVEFAQLGVEDLILVFDSAEPEELQRSMRWFDEEVVGPSHDILLRNEA
jgi:hypothetical protein